jgi:hypothetical protein
MINTILIVVAVVVVLFVVIVALRPSDFRVTRSTSINAPPAGVFPLVNDLHKFQDWSPWAKIDPECKTSFAGPTAGTGAAFSWAGNKKVGEGRMTITATSPAELVRLRLEFLKPFRATNTAEFTFKPEGNHTVVTWSMYGANNFFFKAFGLFIDCDKMCGPDFEKGLAMMKSLAEAASTVGAQR